jgi:hypothetical protein
MKLLFENWNKFINEQRWPAKEPDPIDIRFKIIRLEGRFFSVTSYGGSYRFVPLDVVDAASDGGEAFNLRWTMRTADYYRDKEFQRKIEVLDQKDADYIREQFEKLQSIASEKRDPGGQPVPIRMASSAPPRYYPVVIDPETLKVTFTNEAPT